MELGCAGNLLLPWRLPWGPPPDSWIPGGRQRDSVNSPAAHETVLGTFLMEERGVKGHEELIT